MCVPDSSVASMHCRTRSLVNGRITVVGGEDGDSRPMDDVEVCVVRWNLGLVWVGLAHTARRRRHDEVPLSVLDARVLRSHSKSPFRWSWLLFVCFNSTARAKRTWRQWKAE